MFESLSDRLSSVFKSFRGVKTLDEEKILFEASRCAARLTR